MNGVSSNGEARGVKRQADDTLDDEQRFAKRFNLLNLKGHNGKLYIPIPSGSDNPPPPHVLTTATSARPSRNAQDEHMQLDDTKHTVYIHNLDDELSDIESEDEKLIFLPDIDRKLNKIPEHVLRGDKKVVDREGQELVLYSIPSSLTVPESRDSVRRAIIEARQRARKKAIMVAKVAAAGSQIHDEVETAHGFGAEEYAPEDTDDPDAMDIG